MSLQDDRSILLATHRGDDAAARLRAARSMVVRRVSAALPVRPRLSTIRSGRVASPLARNPTTAIATSASGNIEVNTLRVIAAEAKLPLISPTRSCTSSARPSQRQRSPSARSFAFIGDPLSVGRPVGPTLSRWCGPGPWGSPGAHRAGR